MDDPEFAARKENIDEAWENLPEEVQKDLMKGIMKDFGGFMSDFLGTGKPRRGFNRKTQAILEVAQEVLVDQKPMTVRQVYYQLVARQVIPNNRSSYQAVSKMLVTARKNGDVPWEWIEDRLHSRPQGAFHVGRSARLLQDGLEGIPP